jgi:hypothetical protein
MGDSVIIIPPHDLSIRHVGIVGYKVCVWSNHLWHKVQVKFHENPYKKYLDIKCAQTDMTGEVQVRLGWVGLVRLG